HAPGVHGASGLGGPVLHEPATAVAGEDAAGFIVDAARRTEGLWLVAVGPFTNVALALRRDPTLAERLAGISFMGGATGPGNRAPVAEFNVWADPEAAAVLIGSGARPLRMAGLNLTRQLLLDEAFLAELWAAGTPLADFCAEAVAFALGRYGSGTRTAPAHDVCAVLAVTHPHLVRHEERAVAIELRGEHTRGMTVVDERGVGTAPGAAEPPAGASLVDVGYAIDAAGARAVLLDVILHPD
ncbi:MAG: hypothetical protein GEV08_25340, partial [Acidimicrobiia bacterium]|nr:hypothetical protein [Acidimicrobiia bacterium]